MTDARFPERWLNDRRILRLPDDAFRLFVLSLAWSVANQTDGRIYDDLARAARCRRRGPRGNFYPHWTLPSAGGGCRWEFGQMANGNSFGGTGQYGSSSAWFFGTLEGPVMTNPGCP